MNNVARKKLAADYRSLIEKLEGPGYSPMPGEPTPNSLRQAKAVQNAQVMEAQKLRNQQAYQRDAARQNYIKQYNNAVRKPGEQYLMQNVVQQFPQSAFANQDAFNAAANEHFVGQQVAADGNKMNFPRKAVDSAISKGIRPLAGQPTPAELADRQYQASIENGVRLLQNGKTDYPGLEPLPLREIPHQNAAPRYNAPLPNIPGTRIQ